MWQVWTLSARFDLIGQVCLSSWHVAFRISSYTPRMCCPPFIKPVQQLIVHLTPLPLNTWAAQQLETYKLKFLKYRKYFNSHPIVVLKPKLSNVHFSTFTWRKMINASFSYFMRCNPVSHCAIQIYERGFRRGRFRWFWALILSQIDPTSKRC